MSEQWRVIPGFNGYYEVSDRGRIRRIKPGKRAWKNRAIGSLTPTDYPDIGALRLNLRGKIVALAELVLKTFVGPKPRYHQAGYRDGDYRNVKLRNLYWKPKREIDAVGDGLKALIRKECEDGDPRSVLAIRHGLQEQTVKAICRGIQPRRGEITQKILDEFDRLNGDWPGLATFCRNVGSDIGMTSRVLRAERPDKYKPAPSVGRGRSGDDEKRQAIIDAYEAHVAAGTLESARQIAIEADANFYYTSKQLREYDKDWANNKRSRRAPEATARERQDYYRKDALCRTVRRKLEGIARDYFGGDSGAALDYVFADMLAARKEAPNA